jgi:energy-coupling factor transporter ATP-binding protein EcfA2
MSKPVAKLSKGYRQRVGMAQALLHDPEVLILDEPTSGLDPLQIREVRKLIRELGRTKTILLSTHILQEVEAVASEVIVVGEGRLAFAGTLDELRAGDTVETALLRAHGPQEEGGGLMSSSAVIGALFRKELRSFLGNPTGYVFLTLFIVASAAAAFLTDTFFGRNLADLATLNRGCRRSSCSSSRPSRWACGPTSAAPAPMSCC